MEHQTIGADADELMTSEHQLRSQKVAALLQAQLPHRRIRQYISKSSKMQASTAEIMHYHAKQFFRKSKDKCPPLSF